METRFARKEDFGPETRRWYEVDATGKVLGRLASQVAVRLMGKDRVDFTRHVDTGAYVIVTNAEKIRLTGNKLKGKLYTRYTGYPSGLRVRTAGEMIATHPEEMIMLAVKRMLPRTRLGRQMLKKLRVYRGPDHPHTYAKPEKIELPD